MKTTSPEYRTQPPLHGMRLARGLGLNETARLAGIDPGHLSKFERGEERLGLDNLVRLGRVLGADELVRMLEPYTRGRP